MPELRRGDGTSRLPYSYLYHGRYITLEQAAVRGRLSKCAILYRLKKTGGDMEAALDHWTDGRSRNGRKPRKA